MCLPAQDARQHVMRNLRADFSGCFNSVDVADAQPVGALRIGNGALKPVCGNAGLARLGLGGELPLERRQFANEAVEGRHDQRPINLVSTWLGIARPSRCACWTACTSSALSTPRCAAARTRRSRASLTGAFGW
uniref:Uncharacterized protein n=1 Tax=Ralstonia solanacearum TaxID=305 RepID=A0A0S4UXL4_RALSL|nr:protein of unknown function [Ralstonia solanacearum]